MTIFALLLGAFVGYVFGFLKGQKEPSGQSVMRIRLNVLDECRSYSAEQIEAQYRVAKEFLRSVDR